jgi:hypothetical protein
MPNQTPQATPKWIDIARVNLREAVAIVSAKDPESGKAASGLAHMKEALALLDKAPPSKEGLVVSLALACECLSHYVRPSRKRINASKKR